MNATSRISFLPKTPDEQWESRLPMTMRKQKGKLRKRQPTTGIRRTGFHRPHAHATSLV